MNTKARPVPKFANPGRRARFSFLARDRDGHVVRSWHTLPYTDEALTKSLRGMVRP